MPDGIDLILADHERVNALFEHYETTGDPWDVGLILDALTAHDSAEHAALYPLAHALLHDASIVERCELAHRTVNSQMEHTRAQEGNALIEAVTALRGAVAEHVRDEETNLLPRLAKQATAAQLETLAAQIEQNKQRLG